MRRLLGLAGLVAATALAQTGNSIEGTVLSDRTGQPLRRAHVVLTPGQTGLSAIGVDTDDKGAFVIREAEPGRYSLSASRDGYLSSSVCLMGTIPLARVFAIGAKESVTGLTFRLRPFAVIAGRVSFEDGEPAINVRVEAFWERRNHLRHGYLSRSTVTNDRGEYRLFDLEPGSYLVAATILRPAPANEQVRETQVLQYTTTFYTNTTKLSEAAPVRIEYGQEIGGVDVFLARVRKVKVHGRVLSGLTGETVTATLALQRLDAHNTASSAVNVTATFDRSNRFELRDVTPGAYIIRAEGSDGGKALVGHAPLTVGESDIDDVELTIEGEREASAVLVVEDGVKLETAVHLRFEPRNERAKVAEASEIAGSQGFRFPLMGNEVYDLLVTNLPRDFYVSAVRVNGVDAMPFGIAGSAASADRPFEVVLDSNGGRLNGRVLGADDTLWSRASVALIPDPAKGRVQSYQEGSADENGLFVISGVAPGRYILVAWLDDPPCDYYDPDGLAGCRTIGMSVDVQQGGQQNVELKMKTLAKR
jgi:hypothetical protein